MLQYVKFMAALPPSTFIHPPDVLLKYFLHGCHSDESMLASAAVISSDGLYPPFGAGPNKNLFQHLFGIEFNYKNHSRVRGIRHLNLRTVLASLRTSPTVYHNQRTNSA